MAAVPWWGVYSAVAAPVLLAIGWTLAAVRQPDGYDPVADTISMLSSFGEVDRLILITCLAGLGLAHLVTAIGLRFVPLAGRLVYGLGGVATIVVAAVPKVDSVTPPAHGIAAVVAFVALAAWPAAALLPYRRPGVDRPGHGRRATADTDAGGGSRVEAGNSAGGAGRAGAARRADRPRVLRPGTALTASVVMLLLGLWLASQLPDGPTAGLAERAAAGIEALWPLAVVLVGLRWYRRHPGAGYGRHSDHRS